MRRVSVFFGVLFIVVMIDQLTKEWAQLRGLTTLNTGISFGVGSISQHMTTVAFVCLVLAFVFSWQRISSVRQLFAASLFFSGALSNLFDRVHSGGVRDWLPLFFVKNNLADWAIFLGILLLLWPRTIEA